MLPIVLDPRATPSVFLTLTLPLEGGAPGLLWLLLLVLLLLIGLEPCPAISRETKGVVPGPSALCSRVIAMVGQYWPKGRLL